MLLHYHHQLICLSTEDITPPVLTFINAPSRSGGDFQITWTANENVTAQCTVQTPSLLFGQPCNWSWTGSNLTEGFYSIYVQLTDLAGNSAPPARHSWFVGMSRVGTRISKTTEMEVKAWIGCWNDLCSVTELAKNPAAPARHSWLADMSKQLILLLKWRQVLDEDTETIIIMTAKQFD